MIWVALIVLLLFIYNYIQISKPYINKVNIKSNKINGSLKITQITDFHSNKYIDLDKLIQEIKNYNPDLIMITGDLIDYNTKNLDSALEIVKKAAEINSNVYFVTGNHEDRNPLYSELAAKMVDIGIRILKNESKIISINDKQINIVGVEYRINIDEYTNIFKHINNEFFTILLAHSPNKPMEYLTEKEDLILSGHTHGGQVRLPFIGPVIAPGQGLFPKYDKGIIKLGNTILHIDSGLGNRLVPIRLFNRVQITNMTIESI